MSSMIITKTSASWWTTKKQAGRVLTVGNTTDSELVRHTYATSGSVNELEKLVSNYLDDCECDYEWEEVERAADSLHEFDRASIGNHFFRLTDLESA